MKRVVPALLFFLGIVIVWEEAARLQLWPRILLPHPADVLSYLIQSTRDGTLLEATMVTLQRLLFGYFIGLSIGVPLGLLNARFRFCQDTMGLIALGFQTLPSICWAPLAILWFGQTETAMLFIVVMGSLWSIAIATTTGVAHVPPIYIRAARTMGSSDFHTWLKVILPASLPFIVSGMKQGWAFAWRSLMAAEVYVTILTGFGLGELLHFSRELHAMDAVVAVMLVIIAIGLLVEKLLFSPIEHALHERWGTIGNIGK